MALMKEKKKREVMLLFFPSEMLWYDIFQNTMTSIPEIIVLENKILEILDEVYFIKKNSYNFRFYDFFPDRFLCIYSSV
jgi:hypothetical protein